MEPRPAWHFLLQKRRGRPGVPGVRSGSSAEHLSQVLVMPDILAGAELLCTFFTLETWEDFGLLC
jgi:hypothetical protein